MWALRYLFYRLYLWQFHLESDMAPFNAFLLVVIFLFLNLVALVGVVETVVGRSFFLANMAQRLSYIGVLIVGALLALPLYFTLLYKQRYKRILEQFESESKRQHWIRGTSVVLYLVVSVVLVFAGAMFHGKMINH